METTRFVTPAAQSVPDSLPAAPSAAAMGTGRLEDRYAAALLALAQEQGRVATVEADLTVLGELIAATPVLQLALRNPALGRAGQGQALVAIAAKMGLQIVTQNFLRLVAARGRAAALPKIIAATLAAAAAARGETVAQVASAAPLTDAQAAQLTGELAAISGRRVTLAVTVDPALLGGLAVRLGDRLYDRTLKSHLNRLMLKFEEAA